MHALIHAGRGFSVSSPHSSSEGRVAERYVTPPVVAAESYFPPLTRFIINTTFKPISFMRALRSVQSAGRQAGIALTRLLAAPHRPVWYGMDTGSRSPGRRVSAARARQRQAAAASRTKAGSCSCLQDGRAWCRWSALERRPARKVTVLSGCWVWGLWPSSAACGFATPRNGRLLARFGASAFYPPPVAPLRLPRLDPGGPA